MKKILPLFLLLLLLLFPGCSWFNPPDASPTNTAGEELKLDPAQEATHLSKVADTRDAWWLRGPDMIWGEIESVAGQYDWTGADERVQMLAEMDIYPAAMIKPYAEWDQDACHDESYVANEPGRSMKVGAPCDFAAYQEFVSVLVERYDGDGQNDMPGLTIPIKYWEIMNEPSMQGGSTGGLGEELKFFKGTSEEYLEILKTSYQAIKEADPEAQVVQGGMAGMQQEFLDFWDPVLAGGGGEYFDIANMHTINTDSRREDMFTISFKKYLEKYGLEDKPIWNTEVQFGDLAERPADLESFNKLLARASVFALALGTDKLFFIDNWIMWDELSQQKDALSGEPLAPPAPGDKSSGDHPELSGAEEPGEKDKEEPKKMPLVTNEDLADNSTQKVYLNLVAKVNVFSEVETLKEEYKENSHRGDGATSVIGQYKFLKGSQVVYVLWGNASLPAEITGQVTVTDIYGTAKTMDASEISLSDSPVFVEM